MVLKEKLTSILYSPKNYNGLLDYFSLQEKLRLADVFNLALADVPEPSKFIQDQNGWKNIARARIVSEYESAKEYFGRPNLMGELNIIPMLDDIFSAVLENKNFPAVSLSQDLIDRAFDFNLVSPQELIDLANFESVKYKAYSFIESLDYDAVVNVATLIERKVSKASPSSDQEKIVFKILSFWVLRLKFFGFSRLKISEKASFIKDRIVDFLTYGFDIQSVVIKFLETYQSEQVRVEISNVFKNSLADSRATLGKKENLRTNNFDPTVKNWLEEYFSGAVVTRGEQAPPGAFQIVKFMDNNKNVSFLNVAEKQVLKTLLQFYNFLLSPSKYLEILEAADESNGYINSQSFELPQELQPQQPKLPPVTPVPAKAASVSAVIDKGPDLAEINIDKKLEELKKKASSKNS